MTTALAASVPVTTSHRGFVSAMAIDSVGAGLFQPASTIFLLAMTHLSLPSIGLALTTAGIAALPVGLWAGQVVDRIGPRSVLMVANLAQAIGVSGYLLLHSFWGVALCAWVASAGRFTYLGTFSVAISAIAGPGEREQWFARAGGIRNLGQSAGGLVAAVVLGVGTDFAYTAMIVATAASLLIAVPLMRRVPRPVTEDGKPVVTGSWSTVVRDRPYWIVVAHWAAFALSSNVLGVAIPVYATVVLGLPGWVGGAAFTLNTLLVGFGQSRIARELLGAIRSRVLVSAHVGFALGYLVLLGASAAHGNTAIAILMVGVVIYTVAEIVGWPVAAALATDAAPAALRGRYLALFQLSGSVVTAGAPGMLSSLLAVGATALWLPLVGVAATGAALSTLAGAKVPAARTRIGEA